MSHRTGLRLGRRVMVFMALWLFVASARAECSIDSPSLVSLGTYDPGAPVQDPIAWNLRVTTQAGCTARLQLEALDAAGSLMLRGPDANGLRLVLAQDATGTTPLASAPQDFGLLQIAEGQQATLPLWALRAPGQWLSPGSYSASLRLTLLDALGQSLDRRDMTFRVNVSPTVRAQFGNLDAFAGSNAARLDFGEMAQGAERSTSLSVQANTGYVISLESSQRGHLVNRRFNQARIAYDLRVNGTPLALGASAAGIRIASSGRNRHEIKVQIGPVERVLAGEYADDLLITITAQ